MMLEQYDEALHHLKKVLNTKADYAGAFRYSARCSFQLGDLETGAHYAKQERRFGDPFEYNLWWSGMYSSRRSRGKVR